jgi:hypothetical protein
MKTRYLSVVTNIVILSSLLLTVSGGALASPGRLPTADPTTPGVTLTADAVVRAWPSSSADSLGAIPSRSSVPVTGRTVDFTWWQIQFSAGPGGYAWLAATVVLPNGTAASAPIIQVIQPTPAAPTPEPTPDTCTLDAAFVADVTVPDGTVVMPSQAVNKVWRLRNTGTCTWDNTTVLRFVGGFQLGAPTEIGFPATPPGGTADIAAPMSAPNDFGQFRGIWQLQDQGVNFFGPKLTVMVNVNDPNPATPAPAPAPPAPPQPGSLKIDFWSDSTSLSGGKCTTLHWNVTNVSRVDFNDGKWRGVGGQDSRKECPGFSTTYRLRVTDQRGQTHDREVTVNVAFKPVPNPVYPTAKPMPGPVYPTQEPPMPGPVYPTEEPMPGPVYPDNDE